MNLLKGKNALVTGGSRGIGRAIVRRYAEEGANVAFTCTRITEAVNEFLEELHALGVKAQAYASDAASFEAAHSLVDEVKASFGSIDILVNNAGITRDALLLRMNEQQWDEVLDVNLKSSFNMVHAVAPIMMRQKGGSIINVSSVVGLSGNAGQVNYSAAKAGMVGLAKSVAKELGAKRVRANVIAPGFIETDMTNVLSPEIKERWVAQIPLRRAGTPEDIAGVALFLASDLSAYVTGQVITCCGGMNC